MEPTEPIPIISDSDETNETEVYGREQSNVAASNILTSHKKGKQVVKLITTFPIHTTLMNLTWPTPTPNNDDNYYDNDDNYGNDDNNNYNDNNDNHKDDNNTLVCK